MDSEDTLYVSESVSSSLVAKDVYVVMQNVYRISRNIRAQWFFKNVHKIISFQWKSSQDECSEEIEIISAIPKYSEKFKVDPVTNSSKIVIVPDTKIHFLSTQYRLVFCVDLSPSVSTVDIQHDGIFYEEIISSLQQCLSSISAPFNVPGSNYYFVPQIYVTVICHIPNCPVSAPQVLVQGWILSHTNSKDLVDVLKRKFDYMCKLMEKASSSIQEEQRHFMIPHDSEGIIIDGSIDGKLIKRPPDLSADISTLKLIRYGILALQLLPENSSAGIIVLTDGILNFPNCKTLDSLLTQLRNSTIACSFVQLGSPFHSFSCFGRAPYKELMEFCASATCGSYFPACKNFTVRNSKDNEMNAYHKSLLFWNFQKTSVSCFLEAYEPSPNTENFWLVDNPHFYTVAHQSRVKKKHTEGTLIVSLENLLSCRLREGYSVKSITFDEAKKTTEIRLVLPWMLSTNIEYKITLNVPGKQWKSNNSDTQSCYFEVIVDGCYEFLHDVTCSKKRPIKSTFRNTVITQFWNYIKNLSNTDQILTKLHSFALTPMYYTIPENIKNGVPLFYLIPNSDIPIASGKNAANMQFASFWRTLCLLDINVWQKWMHAHRIGVVLQHDIPLQKNLHLPNSSGRYAHIQCRQASTALYSLLTEISSFVLVENHSYIKLLFDDPDKPPVSFYVIRVSSKPPCVAIRLAFLGGLPGLKRHTIVNELREKILNLKLTKRSASKDYSQALKLSQNSSELNCCFFLKKPVEHILIRYEKLPTDFLLNVADFQGSVRGMVGHTRFPELYPYTETFTCLSKYLMHQRWIWTLQYESCVSLDLKSASKILYTLTNVRLKEGFHFSHSSSGIIYMIQEIPMEIPREKIVGSDHITVLENNCCVVQYIIFPPHTNTTIRDSISEEDDTELTEADGELQLITECWIEPQHGITALPSDLKHLSGLTFDQLPKAIYQKDLDVVKALTTFEHLSSVCEKRPKSLAQLTKAEICRLNPIVLPPIANGTSPRSERLEQTCTSTIPYAFNLLSLLPKCPQTEILFSCLHEDLTGVNAGRQSKNDAFFNILLENLSQINDQEINLAIEDNALLLFQLLHRTRGQREPSVPFPHPFYSLSDVPLPKNVPECSSCLEASLNCKLFDNNHPSYPKVIAQVPKWRCFVKGGGSSQVMLTIVPATYEDLIKLHFPSKNDPQTEVSISATDPETTDQLDDTDSTEAVTIRNENKTEADQVLVVDDSPKQTALLLPMYVYNCVSSAIMNQLVELDQSCEIVDHYESHAFECDCCTEVSTAKKDKGSIPHFDFSKKSVESVILSEHLALLKKVFLKSFAYGVYRSFLMGLDVEKFDAIAAIDDICKESLLEIDITEFVYMVCGHVKDFFTKRSVRQMHLSQESSEDKDKIPEERKSGESETHSQDSSENKDNIQGEMKSDGETPESIKTVEKSLFPLSMLLKYQPCEELHQKHLSIKESFSDILKSFFKAIPSRPDYYYFSVEEDMEDASFMDDESHEEDAVSESIAFEADNHDSVEHDKVSNFCEEDSSSKSFFNTNSSVSSIDKDTEPSASHDKNTFPPLIVHFSCSIKSAKEKKSCPLSSLPTCLNDIIKCLDTSSVEICLEDLRITLDIFCLTVSKDLDTSDSLRHRIYATSASSSSPIPETEYIRSLSKEDDNDSSSSDIATDTTQCGPLENLPSVQRDAVFRCIQKVKWLLQDEKTTVSLNSFPITNEILEMVVEHVKCSKDKLSCVIKEIPLLFVYGLEASLDKFTQGFKRMTPVGYRLEEVNDKYYLVTDSGNIQKPNKEAPISKYNIIKSIPHSYDGTELKRVGEMVKDMPIFNEKNFPFLKQLNSEDSNEGPRGSEAEPETYTLVKTKRDHVLDDSETEDSLENSRPKAKMRKISIKRLSLDCKKGQKNQSLWETERKHRTPEKSPEPNIEVMKTEVVQSSDPANIPNSSAIEESSPDVSLETKSRGVLQDISSTNSSAEIFDFDEHAPVFGSGYGKFNTEDGYEGDSSDCGSDFDLINSLDTRRPVLPKFWLIMTICGNKVIMYFHVRHKVDDDSEFIQHKLVMNEVVTLINKICKEVNQVLLLKSLNETRMCNRLLVPEENVDLWKGDDPNRTLTSDDPEYMFEVNDKYLEAAIKFDPGEFSCPIVWVTHFKLHHRLLSVSHGTHKSCGMQTLRSLLNTISVNNRENMFVYQENTGAVFYIRLYEEYCDVDHQRPEDGLSLLDRCSSTQSLTLKHTPGEFEFDEFRPRVNSGASDSYRQDSISTSSSTKRNQRCIALYVHGIGEVGSDIRKDLVHALQNRLNEGVLDQISIILSRNPSCMLTPEDVQFIQNTSNAPSHEIFFTLPVKLLGYTHSIHMYLRQNLLNFLYNPKYSESKKESHFKAYWSDPVEWKQVDDNDIFLYHSPQLLGRPGAKGIACIVLSFVTGQGKPFQNLDNFSPTPSVYEDGLPESEVEDLTATSMYTLKNERSPGPVALIRFQIWNVGKDTKEHIEGQLKSAVQNSLWDLLMEYRALAIPISDSTFFDDSPCYSEPTTPIRSRRSGISNLDPNLPLKDILPPMRLHSSKEISSSVPDITIKAHSPSPLSKEMSNFKFSNKPQSAKPDLTPETSNPNSPPSNNSPVPKPEKKNLNFIFNSPLKSFLGFGVELRCPAITTREFNLPSRNCINYILREICKVLKNLLRDTTPRLYMGVPNIEDSDLEFIPFDPNESINSESSEDSRPGRTKSFIIIGRNEKQWRAYMGLMDFAKFQEASLETTKTYQKYLTHVCNPPNVILYPESIPSSPTSTQKSTSSLTSVSPNFKSSSACTVDNPSSASTMFVPRQRLLMMYIEDKKVTLYLYNWAQEIGQNLFGHLQKLNEWFLHRNSLLNNLVLQKLGIFQGLLSIRSETEKLQKDTKSPASKNSKDEHVKVTITYCEQLIHNYSFSRESHGASSSRSSSMSSTKSSYFARSLKNARVSPLFKLKYNFKDPVMVHGQQFLAINAEPRMDLQILFGFWQSRGTNLLHTFEKDLRRYARLTHYCFTPILFSPSWRYKVAPIRDHALEPLDQFPCPVERSVEVGIVSSSRSRHSSGSSLKNSDSSTVVSSRARRASGMAGYPGSNQSSPKLRTKNPSEETWHNTVCQNYLQEYIQYLHTVGFITLNLSESGDKRYHGGDEDRISRSDSFSRYKYHRRGQTNYLIKTLLGGLLVFELGLADPYAYGVLYSMEAHRFNGCFSKIVNTQQFAPSFLDELDKVKLNFNLHSFTYDHHLRTIHSYISGQQLLFRHGYHITSFLDDFIKYYQKAPNGARNLIYSGTLTVPDVNMSGDKLYNYIISHNQLYKMTVLRMVPIVLDSSCNLDTEFALVELSARRASYKDFNNVCQMGSFDVGVLINHNTSESATEPNSLVLNYYIILTSQRDLYPKLSNLGTMLGSFKTVRLGSSLSAASGFSSRKTSTGSMLNEKEKFESSGEDSILSSDSNPSRRVSRVHPRGMCDEDVLYLGYFSSQEKLMQQVLDKQAETAGDHLISVVRQAAVHCRRDALWSTLLTKDDSKDHNQSSLTSYGDFNELLGLVTTVSLNEIDPSLTPFMNMHISWYSTLAPLLKTKYADSHREFVSSDGKSLYVAVTSNKSPDSFMLLTIDTRTNKTGLCLVFREEPLLVEQEPSQRLLAMQALVEGFVNACCFHLWTCILPL